MPTFKIGGVDAITQSNDDIPVIPNPVLNNSVTALDTTASNGATANADNSALPLFGCRAFVNFDGTSTTNVTVDGATEVHCAIRSSGNVSKVVRTAQGNYKVYFVIPMPDNNYCAVYTPKGMANGTASGTLYYGGASNTDRPITNNYVYVATLNTTGNAVDSDELCVSIFR